MSVHVDDFGGYITATVKEKVNGVLTVKSIAGSTCTIYILDPAGATTALAAAFVSNGLDGQCRAIIPAGLHSVRGEYTAQVKVDYGASLFHSDKIKYAISDNLAD